MKINTKPQFTKKRIVVLSIIGAAVIGLSAFAWVNLNQAPDQSGNDTSLDATDEPTTGETESPSGTLPSKTDTKNDSTPPSATSDTDEPPEAIESPKIERHSMGSDGRSVKIVALLQKKSNGSCQVRFSMPGQSTLSYSAQVVVGPSSYTCSFTIPASDFPVKGSWDTTVLHKLGDAVANSETTTTEVK